MSWRPPALLARFMRPEKPEQDRCCDTCRYAHGRDGRYFTDDCRRHAPALVVGDSRYARWPTVQPYHWCGDWERNP